MDPIPYEPWNERTPPGPGGRSWRRRWSRPVGSLAERLARARLVFLLERGRGLGDWIALSLAAAAVAMLLAATAGPGAAGRLRAPHLGLDFALSSVEPGSGGEPVTARIYGAGPALAHSLDAGDLVAVETPQVAAWYRVARVEVVDCASPPPPPAGLEMTTSCQEGQLEKAVILAWPVRVPDTNWI